MRVVEQQLLLLQNSPSFLIFLPAKVLIHIHPHRQSSLQPLTTYIHPFLDTFSQSLQLIMDSLHKLLFSAFLVVAVAINGARGDAMVTGAVFCDQCKDGQISLFDYPLYGTWCFVFGFFKVSWILSVEVDG